MARDYREWLKQAEYDMETADLMFSGGRFFYAVFMCHLAIEKALKGLYQKKFQKMPEKTHNLIFFLEQLQISPPEPVGKFIVRLNEASVATRYPETLEIISKNYSKKIAGDIINENREALIWIEQQY
jgi:HEPN domain-containing protein